MIIKVRETACFCGNLLFLSFTSLLLYFFPHKRLQL